MIDQEITLPHVKRMRLVVINQWSEHNLSCVFCQNDHEASCPESQRLKTILCKWSMLDIKMQLEQRDK